MLVEAKVEVDVEVEVNAKVNVKVNVKVTFVVGGAAGMGGDVGVGGVVNVRRCCGRGLWPRLHVGGILHTTVTCLEQA